MASEHNLEELARHARSLLSADESRDLAMLGMSRPAALTAFLNAHGGEPWTRELLLEALHRLRTGGIGEA